MHLIMCSNDETNFMQIDEGENRFCVLKVPTLSFDDPQLLEKMESEIPAFLHFLSERKLHYPENQSRFSFDPKVYETEALKIIQERTQNFLPKQVQDYIREIFMMTGESYIYLSPADIVKGVADFSQIKLPKPAVTDYLKYDLAMQPEARCRYTVYKENLSSAEDADPVLKESKTGFPYKFFYKDFLTEEDLLLRGEKEPEKERNTPTIVQAQLELNVPEEPCPF